MKTRITDWNLFLSVANLPVLAVNASSPYQTAKQLLDAMKASPEKISVATAGLTSTGHMAMELVAKAAGVKYRHVSYDGGNPAVVATVSGEYFADCNIAKPRADAEDPSLAKRLWDMSETIATAL